MENSPESSIVFTSGQRRKINLRVINISHGYRFDVWRNGQTGSGPFARRLFPRGRVRRTRRGSRETARRRTRAARGRRDAVIAYLHRETRVSSARTDDGRLRKEDPIDGVRPARIARPDSRGGGGSTGLARASCSSTARPQPREESRNRVTRPSGAWEKSCRPPPAIRD